MKLLVLISATLSAVSAARQPEEYICYTTAKWGAKPCNFPFVYKGVTYDQCTFDHTDKNNKAWCGTTYNVRTGDRRDYGDCDFQRNRGCGPDPEAVPCVGCPEESEVDDEIFAAAEHATDALSQYRSFNGIADSGCGHLGLVKVENAKKQLVAGTNFILSLRLENRKGRSCGDKTEKICENIEVFKPLPLSCQSPDGCLELKGTTDISCQPVQPEIKVRYCCPEGEGECHADGDSWSIGQCTTCTCLNGQERCTGSCEGGSEGYCDTTQDCYSFGRDPPPPGGTAKYICKNNVCKVSSGCGTQVQNWFVKCSDCNAEDCEDEGVCSFRRGRCIGPEDYPAPSPRPCVTKHTRQQCHFPFDYKGQTYYECTYDDYTKPWCGLVPLVQYDQSGAILDNSEWGECFMAPGSSCRA